MINEIKLNGKIHTRENYEGCFNTFILQNICDWDIEDYAESYLNMVDEDDVETKDISSFHESELLEELKESGYICIKAESLTEEMRIKETIEAIKQ
ncbi:hypothetical protein MHM83_11010 [Tenacibaculum sp. Mcav3-52]|uniref:hypothetical protein n=1 Tax=Tenacibaculum sp. Mcav3-52 TaxID=2917762 RepID=UPI001EF1AE0A|nr:hypothetical protein [Tenacibaculum sp. Mcav3-52]MCG7502402.1 hypothetical protein [Tenacibaculum sp. Mcav3-52]